MDLRRKLLLVASSAVFNEVQCLADSLKFFVNFEINIVKIIDKLEAMLTVRLKIQNFSNISSGNFPYFVS